MSFHPKGCSSTETANYDKNITRLPCNVATWFPQTFFSMEGPRIACVPEYRLLPRGLQENHGLHFALFPDSSDADLETEREKGIV